MFVEIALASIGTLNALLAAGIWFRIGRLEGEVHATAGPMAMRLGALEKRLGRLEEKAMV